MKINCQFQCIRSFQFSFDCPARPTLNSLNIYVYSFLCPNGTIFNQEYFICDWWFNVDCAESAAIAEAKNSELAATREAASAEAAASDVVDAYAAPEGGYLAPEAADSGSGLEGYQAEYSRRRA